MIKPVGGLGGSGLTIISIDDIPPAEPTPVPTSTPTAAPNNYYTREIHNYC